MRLQGTPDEILHQLGPQAAAAYSVAQDHVPFLKRQIAPYQGALLYKLATGYNFEGARILEIGTAWGFSAACMAEGAALAEIVTLNPKLAEFERAVQHLEFYANVQPMRLYSQEYYDNTVSSFDMVFVDGDHDQVAHDFVWWERLNPGGLIVFHDYSPDGSKRPCRPVYDALNKFRDEVIGRDFDVLVLDDQGVGMAGWYK